MKKRLIHILVKNTKKINVFVPKDVRLSFYISPLGDVSGKATFTKQDLGNISLFENKDIVNPDLFECVVTIEEGNTCALLDEGVLKDEPTGADLGLYDYPAVVEKPKVKFDYTKYINGKSRPIDSEDVGINYFNNDNDYFVRNCILAEENPLGGDATKVVFTFNGYLEVRKGDFSIIRNCDCDNSDIQGVYIPQEYVYKYQLRHGDEIICTCKEDNGKMLLDSLFSINQVPRRRWEVNRPWFNKLSCIKSQPLNGDGEYTKAIVNKFKLFDGDNVFVYLTKTTQKPQVLTKFIQELSTMFDKVIYINPNYKSLSLDSEGYNVAKFTTLFNYSFNSKVTTVLLAAQHAKRLVEHGKKVAILIDDIEALNELDKEYNKDMSIAKSLFGSIKTSELGNCASFSFVSLRGNNIKSFDIPTICKSVETLGVVIDNNEIDLFNSYRI